MHRCGSTTTPTQVCVEIWNGYGRDLLGDGVDICSGEMYSQGDDFGDGWNTVNAPRDG